MLLFSSFCAENEKNPKCLLHITCGIFIYRKMFDRNFGKIISNFGFIQNIQILNLRLSRAARKHLISLYKFLCALFVFCSNCPFVSVSGLCSHFYMDNPLRVCVCRRSSLQQMYYLAARAGAIRLPEEYLALSHMGKRPSFGSNSSIGSAYSMLSGHSAGNYSPGRMTPR